MSFILKLTMASVLLANMVPCLSATAAPAENCKVTLTVGSTILSTAGGWSSYSSKATLKLDKATCSDSTIILLAENQSGAEIARINFGKPFKAAKPTDLTAVLASVSNPTTDNPLRTGWINQCQKAKSNTVRISILADGVSIIKKDAGLTFQDCTLAKDKFQLKLTS